MFTSLIDKIALFMYNILGLIKWVVLICTLIEQRNYLNSGMDVCCNYGSLYGTEDPFC
jgi:hypothetical protein